MQTLLEKPPTKPPAHTGITRLDTLETSLSGKLCLLDLNGIREKNAIAAALIMTTDDPAKERRAQRMMQCGTIVTVRRGEDGAYLCANRCHDRLCPECARSKQRKLQSIISERISEFKKPKFVTLTLKHRSEDLGEQITTVISSFRRLRSRAIWKQSVKRGLYAVEWKKSQSSNGWHAHIHCAIDSSYIAKEWLQNAWLEITGDSFIVDIRQADAKSANYMAKYMAKAVTTETLKEELWTVAMALKGRRLCGKFGDERPLTEDEDDNDDEVIGSLSEVVQRAKNGSAEARQILQELCQRYGVEFPPELKQPPDDT